MPEEKRYTLAEAKVALNRVECARSGHRFRTFENGGGEPVRLTCDRCGLSWRVVTDEEFDYAAGLADEKGD